MKQRLMRYLIPLVFCAVSTRGGGAPTEYQLKAAFIYNFAQYVQWPAPEGNPHRPFVIAVIGRDPFGVALDDAVNGQSVDQRPIVVRRMTRMEDVSNCNILFICGSERANLLRILALLRHAPVLTIADMERFGESGGMINLVTERKRVRFDVNLSAMERAGLKAGSQILRLARMVADAPEGQ